MYIEGILQISTIKQNSVCKSVEILAAKLQ